MSALPDPEALLVQALKASEVAPVVGGRIAARLSGTYPAIRVTLVGGPARPMDDTAAPVLQWEAWAVDDSPESSNTASDVAAAVDGVAATLAGRYSWTGGGGEIVASWPVGHYFESSDPTTNRARYIGQIGLLTQP